MKVRVFGLKNCDTCRKARKWLDGKNVDYAFFDIREDRPSIATLKQWHATLGETLLNRRGTTWRQLSDEDKARADRNPPALLHEYPAMMKRPVLVIDGNIHVGFDEKSWRALLKN